MKKIVYTDSGYAACVFDDLTGELLKGRSPKYFKTEEGAIAYLRKIGGQ